MHCEHTDKIFCILQFSVVFRIFCRILHYCEPRPAQPGLIADATQRQRVIVETLHQLYNDYGTLYQLSALSCVCCAGSVTPEYSRRRVILPYSLPHACV